ncbi:MAG TPA: hypothetical protein VIU15_43635 [Streptomyces sp.]
MPQKPTTYVELGYSDDFGLTGLTERLCSSGHLTVDFSAALAIAADAADGSEGEEAVELGEDARRLLGGSMPEEALRAVWLAASGGAFDPAEHGMGVRSWLRELSDLSTARLRQNKRSYVPPPVRPVRDEDLCREVVVEIRGPAGAHFSPDLADGLEQVVVLADADVGFRLFLRVLKTQAVRVPKEQYDRLLRLSDRFGYPAAVVRDGLDVAWPPIDTRRRDTAWDFGLSGLAGNAHQDWSPDGARREIRWVADGDQPEQAPGTAAALLLEDALRLLRSPLSDGTLTTLWVAVSDAALRVDGRDWLLLVVEVCEERLRRVAPTYVPTVSAARSEVTDRVVREIRETALGVADKAVSPYWQPVPAVAAMAALEQVAVQVDPDLGFRLFLRTLQPVSAWITAEQYERYRAIGEQFGYGKYHVEEVEHLVR